MKLSSIFKFFKRDKDFPSIKIGTVKRAGGLPCYCYNSNTIYLGIISEITPDTLSEILMHEYIHFLLKEEHDSNISRKYDDIANNIEKNQLCWSLSKTKIIDKRIIDDETMEITTEQKFILKDKRLI